MAKKESLYLFSLSSIILNKYYDFFIFFKFNLVLKEFKYFLNKN